MSAASPVPSGGYPRSDTSSVYSADQSGARSSSTSMSNQGPPDGSRHIDDLKAEASRRADDMLRLPIGHIVNAASESTTYADFLAGSRRRDQAFLEYMVGMTLATETVQRHKDWVAFKSNQRSTLWTTYWQVINKLKSMEQQFDKIERIIKMENQRSNIQPRLTASKSRPMSQQSTRPGSRKAARPDDEMFLESPTTSANGSVNGARPASISNDYSDFATSMDANSTTSLSRQKPQVRPKPESMHGRAIPASLAAGSSANGMADLAQRFARLRPASGPISANGNDLQRVESAPSRQDSVHSSYQSAQPNSSMGPPPRPNGPRDLPSIPPKLPLDTSVAFNMPQPPSAAYSPARNMQTPRGVDPPRSTARSAVRSNSLASVIPSSASAKAPGNYENGSYFPANGTLAPRAKRQGSIGLPSEGRDIEPKILLDYMNLYKVLIIDVRDRRDYDEGHIDSIGTICISPESLRESMTDEDLERATLLSPDNEMNLFSRRDQFDLVVYYDQNMQTPSFLTKASRTARENSLRCLFDALWEVNIVKTLKRPPLLLTGGLEAWAELLGYAALRHSNTLAMTGVKARAPARRPVPAPSPAAMLAMEKRRRREYNPLDAEEERRWQESARKESVYIPADEEDDVVEEDADVTFYRTQEDFLRRYPAVSPIQESMTQFPERREVHYPVRPAPAPPRHSSASTYAANAAPQSGFPSRPAPAAARVSYSGAHDRNDMHNGANSRSQQLRPYIPPNQMPHNILLPKTGLVNFGVTCYMNATLQALNATVPLSTQFRNDNYLNFLQKDNWKGARGLFPQHFSNLVKHLWVGDVQAVRPTTFRNLCARLDSKYGIDQQQDAKEFLDFALDYLHEDMNLNWMKDPPHVLSKDEETTRERLPNGYAAMIEWSRFCKRSKSLVQDLFAGQHYSKITCLKCGHTSTTYETFFSISVEIPKSGSGDIYSCLKSYCQVETLSGDEKPKCEKCNKPRDHTKQITITRAPRYLVVHFKRFTAKLSKIQTPVSFPLSGLDLTPFVLPPLTGQEREAVARETGESSIVKRGNEECMQPPFLYDAYAVVRHLGQSLSSGHYICHSRDPGRGCWRQFNDTVVSDMAADSRVIGGKEAYVVFFERVGGQF